MWPSTAGDQVSWFAVAASSRAVPLLQLGSPKTSASNASNSPWLIAVHSATVATVTSNPSRRATRRSFTRFDTASVGP